MNTIRTWWARLWCRHHWHSADAMIAWYCCWCGKDVDGVPNDDTIKCAERQPWPWC